MYFTLPFYVNQCILLFSWLKEFASKRWSYNVPKKAFLWSHESTFLDACLRQSVKPCRYCLFNSNEIYDAIQGASLVRVTLWDPLCFNSISNYYSHNSKRAHPNIHNNKVSAPRFSSSQGVGTPSSVVWALSLLPVHVTSGEFRKSTLFRDNVAFQVHFFLDYFLPVGHTHSSCHPYLAELETKSGSSCKILKILSEIML